MYKFRLFGNIRARSWSRYIFPKLQVYSLYLASAEYSFWPPSLSDWDKSVKDLGIGQNPSLGTSYTSLQSTTHWEPDPRRDFETFLFLQNIGIIQMQRGERRKERFIPSYLKFRKSSPPSQRWLARCLNLTFLSWQKFMLNKVSPPAQPPRGRSSCLFCLHYNLLYMASFQKLLHYNLM